MEFLKNNRRLDFLYGDKPFKELSCEKQQTQAGNVLTTVYILPDGLKITNVAIKYENAYQWVNYWENTGAAPTEIISDLWDCKITLPLPHEDPLGWMPVGMAQIPNPPRPPTRAIGLTTQVNGR